MKKPIPEMTHAPCTGCGECCLSSKCEASEFAFGPSDLICPALRLVRPDFYRCLLMEWESFGGFEPLLKEALGVGAGCTNENKMGRLGH